METVDKIKYAVLGSGSSANSYIFQMGEFSFIIDNGFSLKELTRRADLSGFDLAKVDFILLTHTHSDHFSGVGILSRKYKIPVVVHHLLPEENFNEKNPHSRLDIVPGEEYKLDSLTLIPFSTSHDSCCSLGFFFSLGDITFMLLTDTGTITEEMYNFARKTEILFLEANYSPEMLASGSYPQFLKKRISSNKGHLSNNDAIEFLNSIKDGILKKVYLCHLSGSNNTPDRVKSDLISKLNWDTDIQICSKGEIYEST